MLVGRRVPSPPCAWQAHGKLPSCLHASSLSTRRAGDRPPYPGTTKPVVLTLRWTSARAAPTDCTNSSQSKLNRTRCTCRPPARGGASRSDCTNSSRKTSIRRIRSASRRPGARACPTGCTNSSRRTSIRRIGISNSFLFLSEAFASCFLLRRRRRHPPASNGKMTFPGRSDTMSTHHPSLQYSPSSHIIFHLNLKFSFRGSSEMMDFFPFQLVGIPNIQHRLMEPYWRWRGPDAMHSGCHRGNQNGWASSGAPPSVAPGSRTSGPPAMLLQKPPRHFRGCGILPRRWANARPAGRTANSSLVSLGRVQRRCIRIRGGPGSVRAVSPGRFRDMIGTHRSRVRDRARPSQNGYIIS